MPDLLAGVERYVANRRPEQAWLNPAKFLKHERWNDAPAAVPESNGTRSDGKWEIRHGTPEYKAHRDQARNANSPDYYKFPDRPGHIAICATQWPNQRKVV